MASTSTAKSQPKPRLTLQESSSTGKPIATYILTPSTSSSSKARIDVVPPASSTPSHHPTPATSLIFRILSPFLPTNYPSSVTPDYTPYQLYDSLQAFASTIASLLASRAVLTSIGIGTNDKDSASSTATAATILSVIQESIGRLATILFAHLFSQRISAEVKFYRFLADVVNDCAFLLDVLSPSLPTYAKAMALCSASACRAVCGVCGGSSKAILSAHFAREGNIGELNAKDGSQETVVSLVGMWVGGVVVSRVEGSAATWGWMVVLLAVHLWANWMAVKSVRLKGLNRARAGCVLERCLEGRKDVVVEDVGRAERLWARGDTLRSGGKLIGYARFGGLEEFLRCLGCERMEKSDAYAADEAVVIKVCEIFQREDYLLWFSQRSRQCIIALKENASTDAQLKGWCHALRVATMCATENDSPPITTLVDRLELTAKTNSDEWDQVLQMVRNAGWDLSASNITDVASSRRVRTQLD